MEHQRRNWQKPQQLPDKLPFRVMYFMRSTTISTHLRESSKQLGNIYQRSIRVVKTHDHLTQHKKENISKRSELMRPCDDRAGVRGFIWQQGQGTCKAKTGLIFISHKPKSAVSDRSLRDYSPSHVILFSSSSFPSTSFTFLL